MTDPTFDVVVMGGGPAGASLASRLARSEGLRVGLFEREHFPREHIGESFASPVVPCLAETGALATVLDSDCWVRKFGGYYVWDARDPTCSFFRHRLWQRDGAHRWAFHVNRSAFDRILLDHARSCGARVVEGEAVERVEASKPHVHVELASGGRVTCRVFVDASGRANNKAIHPRRGWLSSYRNVAVWGHFLGGRAAQSLPGAWNIFRENNLSPIGCFAYTDGWCWYIPVRQCIGDRCVLTHSIGIVTDPEVIKRSPSLTRIETFMATVTRIPLLRDLVRDIRPVYTRLNTATNYSMISPSMCDVDRRLLSIGDAAFFVDPLFSSGVSFAMLQAAAAAQVIQATLSDAWTDEERRELWADYDATWSRVASAFATSIDQWYAAIAHDNPESVYWHERASNPAFLHRMDSFDWLLDCDPGGDLLYVVTRGTGDVRGAAPDGPLSHALDGLAARDPAPTARLSLKPGITVRRSVTLGSALFGGTEDRRPSAWACPEFWSDPQRHKGDVAPLFSRPRACVRVGRIDGTGAQLRCLDPVAAADVAHLLGHSMTYEQLRRVCSTRQWDILLRLLAAGLLDVESTEPLRVGSS